MSQNEKLKIVIKDTPNNSELGKIIRTLYNGTFTVQVNGEDRVIDANKDYPNDMSLGEAIRKLIKY